MQKAILQSDVQSKSDKSPVTVADYGLLLTFLCILVDYVQNPLFFLFADRLLNFVQMI
jgi:3'(2'), 5'-bisphosphate nucleotidase/inositol polyphosphate 1-phosphatase